MAKGFGTKPDQQLGYVLDLMPEVHAYAAKFSMEFPDQNGPFIGITSELQEAQVWKGLKQAKQAIMTYYADFLVDQLKEISEVRVVIKRLKRSASGELKTETAEILEFSAVDLKG